MSWTFLIAVSLVAAVPVVLAVVIVVYVARRRRAFLTRRAHAVAQLGWIWVPPSPWLAEVAADLFQRGTPGQMAAGAFRSRGVCALDYTYTTVTSDGRGGVTTQSHDCQVIALNLPAALPPLTLTAESGLRRLVSGRDLELESDAFNDRFRIACGDNRYASAVLHPRLMEWMLANPGLEWRIAGNALVSWGTGLWTVPDALARLEAMSRVVDLLPPFVIRDYGQPVP